MRPQPLGPAKPSYACVWVCGRVGRPSVLGEGAFSSQKHMHGSRWPGQGGKVRGRALWSERMGDSGYTNRCHTTSPPRGRRVVRARILCQPRPRPCAGPGSRVSAVSSDRCLVPLPSSPSPVSLPYRPLLPGLCRCNRPSCLQGFAPADSLLAFYKVRASAFPDSMQFSPTHGVFSKSSFPHPHTVPQALSVNNPYASASHSQGVWECLTSSRPFWESTK